MRQPPGKGKGGRPKPPGRGAISNPTGRYEPRRVVFLPEQEADPAETDSPPRLATTVTPETVRSVITRNDSPDVPFDTSINPYRGCEHGCIYCFARPTHAYLGLSPGLDFESRLFSKPDAAERLAEELSRPGYRCEAIALGANTDPYQPIERELRITRGILEVLAAHHHPLSIVTKSHLVLRDLDLLRPMAAKRLASVFFSVTTLENELARRMEPRAPAPARRLEAIRALSAAGVPTGVLASPMVPGLNDDELESILEAAAAAGALSAGYILLRLPGEVATLFSEWLDAHYPLRKSHILSLIRQTRGGKLYDPRFGERMRGEGPYADLLARRFALAVKRLGLSRRPELDVSQFRVTAGTQLKLF